MLSSVNLLPKCLRASGIGLAGLKRGARNSMHVSHVGGRDLILRPSLLPPRVCIEGSWHQEPGSQDSNQQTSKAAA